MKKIIIGLVALAFSVLCFAQEIEVTPENFAKEVTNSSDEYFVLKVYADWCSPCQKMKKVTEELSNLAEFKNKNIKFKKLNCNHAALTHLLGVKYLPTLILYGPDGEITRLVGGMSKIDVKSALKKNFNL
jgi:thioredoxin-like negative regulator of GroEL